MAGPAPPPGFPRPRLAQSRMPSGSQEGGKVGKKPQEASGLCLWSAGKHTRHLGSGLRHHRASAPPTIFNSPQPSNCQARAPGGTPNSCLDLLEPQHLGLGDKFPPHTCNSVSSSSGSHPPPSHGDRGAPGLLTLRDLGDQSCQSSLGTEAVVMAWQPVSQRCSLRALSVRDPGPVFHGPLR